MYRHLAVVVLVALARSAPSFATNITPISQTRSVTAQIFGTGSPPPVVASQEFSTMPPDLGPFDQTASVMLAQSAYGFATQHSVFNPDSVEVTMSVNGGFDTGLFGEGVSRALMQFSINAQSVYEFSGFALAAAINTSSYVRLTGPAGVLFEAQAYAGPPLDHLYLPWDYLSVLDPGVYTLEVGANDLGAGGQVCGASATLKVAPEPGTLGLLIAGTCIGLARRPGRC